MTANVEALTYQSRDSSERFRMEPYKPTGPEDLSHKWPQNKRWFAVNMKTGEKIPVSDQEIQLWYRPLTPAELKA